MAASQPLSTYPISHGFLMAFSTSSQPQHTHILFVHLLFVSIVIQPLHRHQNHIKTSSKLLAFCLRSDCFQKIRTKILLVWMNRQVRYADFHLQKSSTLRGGYRKDRDCSRLFLLSVAAPRLCIVRYFRFSSFNRPQYPWIILR